jgi:nucleotide-binding universal stress UspA family protein
LLRKLGIPVLTVCHVGRPLEFSRILFATDFGPDALTGFRFALEAAKATKAKLIVVHSMEPQPLVTYETPEIVHMLKEARRDALERVRTQFAEFESEAVRNNVRIECVLKEGDACETLVRTADENDADFVILGLRKKGIVERAFLGSTAEAFIRGAHVPVLSIPIGSEAPYQKKTPPIGVHAR